MSKKSTPNPNYIEWYNLKNGLIYKCKTLEEYEEKKWKIFEDMIKRWEAHKGIVEFFNRNSL